MKKYVILIGLSLLVCLSCKKQKEMPYKSSMRETLLPQIKDAVDHSDFNKIILLCDSLIKNGEKYDDVVVSYAEALVATGKANQAITVLKKELENKDTHNKKYYLLHEMGDAYLVSGDTANAIANYQEVLRLNQSYARPYIRLAEIYEHQREKEKARDYYLTACDLFVKHRFYKETMEYGLKAFSLDSTNVQALEYVANAHYRLGDYANELVALQSAHAILWKRGEKNGNLSTEDAIDFLETGCRCAILFFAKEDYNMAWGYFQASVLNTDVSKSNDDIQRKYAVMIAAIKYKIGDKQDYSDLLSVIKERWKDKGEDELNKLLTNPQSIIEYHSFWVY